MITMLMLGVSLAIPAIRRVREVANRSETGRRIGQLALSLHACNDAHRRLPPAFDSFGDIDYPASLHVHLLPFVQEGLLHRTFLTGGDADVKAIVRTYHSPEDYTLERLEGVQNFAGNLRVFSDKGLAAPWDKDMPALSRVEPGRAGIPRSFVDGVSNGIVFTTKLGVCGDGGSRYADDPTSYFAALVGDYVGTKPASSRLRRRLPAHRGAQLRVQPVRGARFHETRHCRRHGWRRRSRNQCIDLAFRLEPLHATERLRLASRLGRRSATPRDDADPRAGRTAVVCVPGEPSASGRVSPCTGRSLSRSLHVGSPRENLAHHVPSTSVRRKSRPA